MEDEQIIQLFFRRAEIAIEKVQEKYDKFCRYVVSHVLEDDRDIEECVNDAYLRVWNAIPPEHPESLRAYLAKICRNLALDRYSYNSAQKRNIAIESAFEELENFLPTIEGRVDEELQYREFQMFLNDFLKKQSKEARIYFVRRYFYGESISEISKSCKVHEEKVKATLYRMRKRLHKVMREEDIYL